jgi:cytochrome c oxidase subunit III
MRDSPFRDARLQVLAGIFGLRLFLVSLSILFLAGIIAFIVARWQLELRGAWPRDLPPLPRLLWLSTVVLAISSFFVQFGLHNLTRARMQRAKSFLLLATLLGIAFLLVQAKCWLQWMEPASQRWHDSDEYRFALTNFYVLTGIHALHVIAGLIPMAIVSRKVFDEQLGPDNCSSVRYVATYWHFLGLIWLMLYGTLLLSQ